MPRVPGRKPTQRKFKINEVEVGSFLADHEERYWRRKCNIAGCDHRLGPDTSQPGWHEWEPCSTKVLPGFMSIKGTNTFAGYCCPCHVEQILELNYT